MVQNNKVLTVSYGTFSCTLEGFEDSFGTMKAIAEYFRDLAADDRYFGAEPPQPDADMLARIAQREIARQVEARTGDGGIHLRAAAALAPAPAAPAPEPEADPESKAGTAQPVPAEDAAETETAAPPPAAVADDQLQAAPEADVPGTEAAAPAPDAPAEEDAAAAEAQPAEEPEAPAPQEVSAADSIAAKLQRIRAVVAQTPADEFSEDQHAESVAGTDDTLEEDGTGEEPWFTDEQEDEVAIRAFDLMEGGDTAVPADEEESGEDSLFGGTGEAEETKQPDSAAAEAAGGEPARKPFRARIAKVKRATLDQALAGGALEEVAGEDAGETDRSAPESSLSDEEEAELLRELAEVEAELLAGSGDSEEEEAGTEDETAETPGEPAAEDTADPAPAQEDLPDSDVSRLMAAADARLEDPEATSLRETYSRMRAAVAAAQADPGTAAEDAAEAYRDDLASVVRPRRPDARQGTRGGSRPAPLKLVAEQRIDSEPAQPAAPVRPRRVSAEVLSGGAPAAAGSEGGFAAYAEQHGAHELEELLEAAAAYLSFVEGRGHFSRPQLINKVRSAGGIEFNREDGLRFFGQLLREGKLERAGNGRFTVSSEIGYRPDERAAG
ncbi:chemotaxis protein CheA [Roseobacteraceae bacterium NS-SX3]